MSACCWSCASVASSLQHFFKCWWPNCWIVILYLKACSIHVVDQKELSQSAFYVLRLAFILSSFSFRRAGKTFFDIAPRVNFFHSCSTPRNCTQLRFILTKHRPKSPHAMLNLYNSGLKCNKMPSLDWVNNRNFFHRNHGSSSRNN